MASPRRTTGKGQPDVDDVLQPTVAEESRNVHRPLDNVRGRRLPDALRTIPTRATRRTRQPIACGATIQECGPQGPLERHAATAADARHPGQTILRGACQVPPGCLPDAASATDDWSSSRPPSRRSTTRATHQAHHHDHRDHRGDGGLDPHHCCGCPKHWLRLRLGGVTPQQVCSGIRAIHNVLGLAQNKMDKGSAADKVLWLCTGCPVQPRRQHLRGDVSQARRPAGQPPPGVLSPADPRSPREQYSYRLCSRQRPASFGADKQ